MALPSRAERRDRRQPRVPAGGTSTRPPRPTGASKWFSPSYDPTGLDARAGRLALADLPAETREIIVMHVWGSLTFEQIAQAVESSAATCYRRYAEGLEKLRLKLGVERPAKTQKTK